MNSHEERLGVFVFLQKQAFNVIFREMVESNL